ncbi:hypothetical protein [Candidiatus Paracoxiella cheracis]|uniref:hypothetical protein n=1 Tax=Candidiatus Paracoxiella cheracis TaxID=3405120 RepID=UPI003BF55AFB
MRDDVFQELESALGRQCTECIQFYVNQIPSYLSDVSRDEQEQQRRVEKILSSQCREAIRKIPAANLAALATNISGTEALLSSRCPKAIEEIPDANIATFATNDRGIKYLLASHNSKVIKKIPTPKLTALAASGPAGVESIIASQCSDPMERVPSEILYQYLFDPNKCTRIRTGRFCGSYCAAQKYS